LQRLLHSYLHSYRTALRKPMRLIAANNYSGITVARIVMGPMG